MNLASTIVVAVLLWCFFFFISLPFGVEREEQKRGNFSDIRMPRLWPKMGFAFLMSALMTVAFYLADHAGYFDGILG